jgi:hypothetical protein
MKETLELDDFQLMLLERAVLDSLSDLRVQLYSEEMDPIRERVIKYEITALKHLLSTLEEKRESIGAREASL